MGTNGNGAGRTGDSGAEIEREPLVRIVDIFTEGLRDINQLHVDTGAKVAGLLIRAIGAQTEQIAKLRARTTRSETILSRFSKTATARTFNDDAACDHSDRMRRDLRRRSCASAAAVPNLGSG